MSNHHNLTSVFAGCLIGKHTIGAAMLALAVVSLGLVGCVSGTPGTDPGNSVAPSISTQPSNQSVKAGQTATFTVVAAGTAPLSYQWQKGTTNITGATAASYTTPATTAADSGSTFRVVVSNSVGSATSNNATLTVNVPPSITTQPTNQTVTAGQTATFTVVATGTAPLSYQWQKGGTSISGATSASYTTPATTTADSGSTFRVIVTNSAGSATSNSATLTVTATSVAPSITTQPTNQAVNLGQTATFTVVATGTTPLSYQWQKGTTNIAGATSASYTTPATTAADSGSTFRVVVSNSVGSATSNNATLTVNVPPSITTQPTNQTVTAGQTATFTVVATGTAPLSYQWQKGTTNITGATAASYTTPATTSGDNGAIFRVVVSNVAGSLTSNGATLTVNVPPSITTQPTNQTVTAGQTATFTVVAAGTAPLSYQWQKGTTNIAGATSASYTTPATTTADSGSTFQVIVSNSYGSMTSSAATLTVNAAPPPGSVSVLTYHNDNARTGLNPNETILTTANVNSAKFGKIGTLAVDGLVDAETLYVPNLTINSQVHNVVFVATEHDSVYAFDADTFVQLWHTSVLAGTSDVPGDDHGCGQVAPEVGITSTPVIDPSAGPHGTIFVVGMSKDTGGKYHHRLYALDLTTGGQVAGPTEIQASFPGTGGNSSGGQVTFDPYYYKDRAALLLLNGVIYTTWASHCDSGPYTGWIIGYNESTLQRSSVLNITPNGDRGAIWMSGGGPAADSSGNVYLLDANGTFETTLNANGFPSKGDYGNAFLKISTAGNSLSVADYFNMHDTVSETNADFDFGSGGAVVLLDLKDNGGTTWHLAIGAGKDSRIYVVNRDNMGKFNATTDNVYQEVTGAFTCSPGVFECVFSTPAYFNNTIYYAAVNDTLKAFPFANAKLVVPSPPVQSPKTFGYPGTTPSISANGTSNGIVWAIENGTTTGRLHAYDATNVANELYNGQFSTNSDCKFVTPMIANGKVYVGTATGVVVFGLLP